MTDLYAIIRDNLVIRMIVADAPFVEAQRAASAAGATGILEPGDQIIGPAPESCANGWRYDPATGGIHPPASAEAAVVDLAEVKATAVAAINAAAERELNALMPPGRVQVLLEQARQADAIPEMTPLPDPADYPLLAACIGPWGADIGEVMLAALDKAERWRVSAAGIEAVRASAQAAICSAEDAAEIRAIMAALAWP